VDELHAPDAHLMFFDEVLAFDHVRKQIHLMVTAGARKPFELPGVEPGKTKSSKITTADYASANRRLDRLEKMLNAALPKPKRKATAKLGALKLTARTRPAQFLKAVEKTKNYITAGDIFQCVLSQRFDCTPGVDAFDIYRSLRIVNPSPYLYFLRFNVPGSTPEPKASARVQGPGPRAQKTVRGKAQSGSWALNPGPSLHIVGSSPEMLVRVSSNGKIEYRPIAGTRPRGADEALDREMEAGLRADAKEIAEHVMLVDLGRNDVGRVSEYGSVRVKDLMFVERYSHVMHLVSALEGTLRKDLAPIDAFKACFPAGTLSGAPKIRAMEIIDELEPARRGVYGGAIFYADFAGNLDSCIAIRTLFMDGEEGHVQAGAGIVADSVPQKEHEECRNKAAAVVRAIERARAM